MSQVEHEPHSMGNSQRFDQISHKVEGRSEAANQNEHEIRMLGRDARECSHKDVLAFLVLERCDIDYVRLACIFGQSMADGYRITDSIEIYTVVNNRDATTERPDRQNESAMEIVRARRDCVGTTEKDAPPEFRQPLTIHQLRNIGAVKGEHKR